LQIAKLKRNAGWRISVFLAAGRDEQQIFLPVIERNLKPGGRDIGDGGRAIDRHGCGGLCLMAKAARARCSDR